MQPEVLRGLASRPGFGGRGLLARFLYSLPEIPARVIDELMGHQRSRHGDLDGGSRIGARYRHTTDEMAARVLNAIEARVQIVLRVAEETTGAGPNRESFRVF